MKDKISIAASQYISKFNSEYEVLINGLDNPKVILTKLFNPNDHQPFYNYITTALRKEGISYHNLQKYLATKVKKYFLEFDNDVEIDLSYDSRYPASMAVKFKGYSVITFSFFYHSFSKEVPNRQIEYLRSEIERRHKDIEKTRKEIAEYKSYLENKLNFIKPNTYKKYEKPIFLNVIPDLFRLIFFRKRISNNLKYAIERREKWISDDLEAIENSKSRLNELEAIVPKLESKYRKWEEKMIELNYRKTK